MNKKAAGIVLVVVLILAGGGVWYLSSDRNTVKKPALWGMSNPPEVANLTWTSAGNVQVARATLQNAPEFYGEFESDLAKLGYAMDMGNWSSTECQWSVWSSEHWNRTYYIAYSSNKFLAIRGPYNAVMNATNTNWLCHRPKGSTLLNSPSPQKTAEQEALLMLVGMMRQGINASPANWTGPLPDWYLSKVSFRVDVGRGVDVLILMYTSEDQMKYAEYLLKKEDKNLRILEDSEGQYYDIIVLKGDPMDVNTVVKLIQNEGSAANSTLG